MRPWFHNDSGFNSDFVAGAHAEFYFFDYSIFESQRRLGAVAMFRFFPTSLSISVSYLSSSQAKFRPFPHFEHKIMIT
jgi:hypothetical protein